MQRDFGYSTSGDERACRSRGTRVRGSLKFVRVHASVHHWAPSIASRSVSLVDARSRREPLPESFSSESPPEIPRLIPAAAREKRSERPQLRGSVALLQERYPQTQLRQLEERAEPLHSVPWRPLVGFGAESTTWAPPQSRSECWQPMHYRISNLVFGTSYVGDVADMGSFKDWLIKTPHHCHVILCQSIYSAVAEWLNECSMECEVELLKYR